LGCLRSRRGLNINDFVEDGVIKEVVSLLVWNQEGFRRSPKRR